MNVETGTERIHLDFTSRGRDRAALTEGWSNPEEHGTWSLGERSRLILPLPPAPGGCRVSLCVIPFIDAEALPSQRLRATVNGLVVIDAAIADRRVIDCDLSPDVIAGQSAVTLELWHPDAMSPMALGRSSDVRALAFLLQYCEVSATDAAAMPPAALPLAAEPPASPQTTPVFAIVTMGNLANRMIQYMAALAVQARAPGCRIARAHLPEWGIDLPDLPGAGRTEQEAQLQHLDVPRVAERLRTGEVDRIDYAGFGQRLENFPDIEVCRRAFVTDVAPIRLFGDDVLLINVRSAEIVAAIHPDYTLIPPEFYADLVAATGLHPVFMGQTESNGYTDRLRRHFPDAEFLPSGGALADFQTMRHAANIVVSVSTFSWLAAWLSHARQIHLPVTGFLNPMQEPRIDLLPLDDPRYRFYLFPVNRSAPPGEQAATHAALLGQWRLVSPAMLATMRATRPRFARSLRDCLMVFDADDYLARWPEFGRAMAYGGFSSALDHYLRVGYAGNLEAFPLDRAWYCRQYPLAAFEVAQGDFLDLEHQYAAVGRLRGWRPISGGDKSGGDGAGAARTGRTACRIAIVAKVRDEAAYLLEWVAFHLVQGVQAFRIYDNASSDATTRLLRALSRVVPLELVPWSEPFTEEGARENYRRAAAALRGEATFAAFIDVDEFLFSTAPGGLPASFAQVAADVGAVAVNQSVFGSGGAPAFEPDLVTARFTRRAPRDHVENQWFKTVARPECVDRFDTEHSVRLASGKLAMMDGEPLTQPHAHPGVADRVAASPVRLHHYMLKSRGEFVAKKRRWAQGESQPDWAAEIYSDGYFLGRAAYIDLEHDPALADIAARTRTVMKTLFAQIAADRELAGELVAFYQFLG